MRLTKTLAAAVFALLCTFPAHANAPQISETVGGQSAFNVSASLTRPANTTAYTADTAVCQSTSVVCTPLELRLARVWAELHEADRDLALELARKLPRMEIRRQ